jgi:ABC-type branched-subunit amino acid transport system substrate-binding protein
MLVLATIAWAAGDCKQRPRLAEIGLTSVGLDEPLVRVAQETLDSLGRGSALRLVLLPVPSGEVMTEVSRAAYFVARSRVIGVTGPTSSQAAMETASIYADGAVPHIITTGTNRRLAALGPWTFALAPDDSMEAAFIASFVRSRLPTGRLVMVQATDLYGWGIGDATASALERQGRALVAHALRLERPDLRVLFTSGYAEQSVAFGDDLAADSSFLPKPFTGPVLARRVRELLDRPRRT